MATQVEMSKRILAAAQSGDVDILQDCINKGAEVNCQDYNGFTPLNCAAMEGKTEVVDLLLKSGASLSVMNKQVMQPSVKLRWTSNAGAKWATFGKQNWRCGMNQTSG